MTYTKISKTPWPQYMCIQLILLLIFSHLYIVPAESLASISAPDSFNFWGRRAKQYVAFGLQLPYSSAKTMITCVEPAQHNSSDSAKNVIIMPFCFNFRINLF